MADDDKKRKERKSSRRDKEDRRSRSYSPRYRSSRSRRSRSRSSRRDRHERRSRRSRSRSPRRSSRRSRSPRRRSKDKDREEKVEVKKAVPVPAPAPAPVAPPAPVPVQSEYPTMEPPSSANSQQSSITQMMQQYPSLSIQEILLKMSQSTNTLSSAVSLKPMRELYVGNLPPNVTGSQLQEFLGTIIQQVGLSLPGQPGNPILSAWISTDNQFAFLEMRTVEECNLALLLNQLNMLGRQLKFGRPRSFVGPAQPMPNISSRTQTALVNLGCTPNPMWFAGGAAACGLAAAGLLAPNSGFTDIGQLPPDNTSNRLLMANIPTALQENQVAQLLEPFGEVSRFLLVKDSEGNSTGSALFEYKDEAVTQVALDGLNGLDIAGSNLIVQRAPPQGVIPEYNPNAPHERAPTEVIELGNMVQESELEDEETFNELKEDIEEECSKYGSIVSLVIPRPQDGIPGVGKVFIRFENIAGAVTALKALKGRKFGGNVVAVSYIDVDDFENNRFS
ncbi:splicing factor U2af large subunit [Thraustotheca clavata]|uniref:Splicing factor U2af large subunit n=1 Tax=Thraustotheca clavata TaxID=74557 RepID=A0A1V9ZVU4_9STRA|nr:splicing factor U2af large subunit [Thraustotheca clavata]